MDLKRASSSLICPAPGYDSHRLPAPSPRESQAGLISALVGLMRNAICSKPSRLPDAVASLRAIPKPQHAAMLGALTSRDGTAVYRLSAETELDVDIHVTPRLAPCGSATCRSPAGPPAAYADSAEIQAHWRSDIMRGGSPACLPSADGDSLFLPALSFWDVAQSFIAAYVFPGCSGRQGSPLTLR